MKRQQRIQEQLDQEQLVEAGIILPSSRSPDKDELSSVGSSTEENDYCKSYKPVKKMPRLPAYDWWNPGIKANIIPLKTWIQSPLPSLTAATMLESSVLF